MLLPQGLIIGGGGRESAIYDKLSYHNTFLYSGNVFNEIIEICINKNIDMVVPCSETYLCLGIKDYITERISDIKVFGPTKDQAQIATNTGTTFGRLGNLLTEGFRKSGLSVP